MTATCECGRIISANKTHCAGCAGRAGCLEILNVQGGDVQITFTRGDVAETIRAKRIVTDMLRRGYALVVEVERDGKKAYERVQSFDEERGEYIIADLDSEIGANTMNDVKLKPSTDAAKVNEASGLCLCGKPIRHRGACKGKRQETRLPMEKTRATAVGRSAGG